MPQRVEFLSGTLAAAATIQLPSLERVVMTLFTRGVADDQLGQYFRRMTAIADRLGKSLDYAKVMAALQRIHDGNLEPGEFLTYLHIMSGGKTREDLHDVFRTTEFILSASALDMMWASEWGQGQSKAVRFARAKVGELGFWGATMMPTHADVLSRIHRLGHSVCAPYDGPALRLAHIGQPIGDSVSLAMRQIIAADGFPRIFVLSRDERGLLLDARLMGDDDQWNLDDEIVFRLGKK